MRILHTFLELLFPARCVACGVSGSPLCHDCLKDVPKVPEIENPSISALYSYRHPAMKKALWALKYRNNRTLAEIFGASIYEYLLEHAYELTAFSSAEPNVKPVIVPIPISKKRLRERGFNQSEKIIEALKMLDESGSFVFDSTILYKTKETPPQASIKERTARLENTRGCFAVRNHEKIKNKVVIVVDDITTTGATLREAIAALENAGAAKAIGVAIAH